MRMVSPDSGSWISGDAQPGQGTWERSRLRAAAGQRWEASLSGSPGPAAGEKGKRAACQGCQGMNGSPFTSFRGTRKERNSILISFWLLICDSLNGTGPVFFEGYRPRSQSAPRGSRTSIGSRQHGVGSSHVRGLQTGLAEEGTRPSPPEPRNRNGAHTLLCFSPGSWSSRGFPPGPVHTLHSGPAGVLFLEEITF